MEASTLGYQNANIDREKERRMRVGIQANISIVLNTHPGP